MTAMTGRAKYQQVADDLRVKIAAGDYAVGSELPSTTQLMAHYAVSSTVAKSAVKELKTEGLVAGQPGKAVYVLRQPDAPEPSPDYTELMSQIGALRQHVQTALESVNDRLTKIEAALNNPAGD